MSRIRVLDPVVRDQIAAGEVVERPASVVKELVENALDAEARSIRVAVVAGGLDRIVVDDDGVGIEREDLPLAVARHATSKLARVEDLAAIATLGFRGEALAAIAAVAPLVIESRTADTPFGWRLSVEPGRAPRLEPVSRAVGTRVTVRDLFCDVPARKKALLGARAELARMLPVVGPYAFAHPHVRFSFVVDGTVRFDAAGDGDPRTAIAAVWGPDVASHLLPVRGGTLGDAVQIAGWVAPPDLARGNRQAQVLVVNGRVVRNIALRAAAEQAFEPRLPDRRYPCFWIDVRMPPSLVDPNAHPTKAEVRLAEERAVAAAIYSAVRHALTEAPTEPLTVRAVEATARAAEPQPTWWDVPDTADTAPPLHAELAELVPLAQWAARYIVAQGPKGLYLVDQHAAHERVYYDRFRARDGGVIHRQPLLLPLTVTLSAAEWAAFLTHGQDLAAAGFELEPFGGTTVVVRAVPAALAEEADLGLVSWVLQSLAGTSPVPGHPAQWAREARLALAACKAAVKASRALSREEMAALLQALAATAEPRQCPHGRPTILHWTVEEVDRQFGR